MWSFFTPLLFLLLHVRVSDRDTDLVSLGVAACCVTLLHPHFLFVVAVVYTAACRVPVVTRPTGSDSKSQLLLLLYFKKLRCEGTSVDSDNDSCHICHRYHCPDLHLIITPSSSGVGGV